MPQRPLYSFPANALPRRGASGNAGLWYDKFCDRWHIKSRTEWTLANYQPQGSQEEINPKLEWIESLGTTVGDAHLIAETVRRQADLILGRAGTALHRKTVERFVTGLGREHPIENGFAWHQTLGTPYLPGSSVKGLVRAWAHLWLGQDARDRARIFGPEAAGRSESQGAGSVVFLDALPLGRVVIEPEVMTPHYDPYYQRGEDPGDWHSPLPIPFLAVARGQSFLFGVLPRHAASEMDCGDCTLVAEWLDQALMELGAGAKTAVGFGRFAMDGKAQAAFEDRRRAALEARARADAAARDTAGLSPAAREFIAERNEHGWQRDKDAFLLPNAVDAWLNRLEASPDWDALGKLAELVEQHFTGVLTNPDRVKGKKAAPAYNPRPRAIAHRVLRLRKNLEGRDG